MLKQSDLKRKMLKTFPPEGEGLYPAPWNKVEEVMVTFAENASRKILSLFGMYQELSDSIEKAA